MDVVVYSQYYCTHTPDRQLEIDECLRRNLNHPGISRMVLFCESDTPPLPEGMVPVEVVASDERITYAEWFRWVKRQGSGIGLLLNADICLDEGLEHLTATGERRSGSASHHSKAWVSRTARGDGSSSQQRLLDRSGLLLRQRLKQHLHRRRIQFPRQAPWNAACMGGSSGRSRARGLPPLATTIVSPAWAASIKREKWVLASCTFTTRPGTVGIDGPNRNRSDQVSPLLDPAGGHR